MSALRTTPNIIHPDDIYQLLHDMQAGLNEYESALVNAKLILLLINHVGDEAVIRQAIAFAREDVTQRVSNHAPVAS